MRKRLFLIICIAFHYVVLAENNDLHLKYMVQCINDSNYQCANNELQLIQNWEYNVEITNIEFALQFINIIANNQPPIPVLDSLRQYVSNATAIAAMQAKFEERPLDIITYGLLTLDLQSSSENKEEIAALLCMIGNAYSDIGNYLEALEFIKRAIDIYGNQEASLKASLLVNMSAVLWRMCEYEQAYICINKVLDLISENSIKYYTASFCLNNISGFYQQIGLYNLAEQYLQQALDSIRLNLGEENTDYMTYVSNLGVIYDKQGKNDLARYNYVRAFEIATKLQIEDKCTILLQNIGTLYHEEGKNYEAIQYLLKALDISNKNRGKYHPEQAVILSNMGNVYCAMGDNVKAEQCFIQALGIYQYIGEGKIYHAYVPIIYNVGFFYIKTNQYAKAASLFYSLIDIKKQQYIQSVDFMSEKERLTQWSDFFMHNTFEKVIPLITYLNSNSDVSSSEKAYDNELFLKGLFLRSADIIRNSVLTSKDTTLIRQWYELVALRRQILILEEKNSQTDYLDGLKEEAERKDKLIAHACTTYREHQAMWQITWDSVRNHLSPNEVAIEYFSAPLSEDSTMYCALLLRHDSEHPEMIPLFEQKEITSFMSFSSPTITNQTYDFYGNGDTISQLIWSKILPQVKEGETIYFAPSGMLHQLAIEYLPYDENRTMSDVYNMVRLSSTREIVLNKQNTEYTTATIYGGIAYDLEEDILLAESENYAKENLLASRSIENDTLNRGNVKYLPGTKKEAESINLLLKQNNISAKLYTTAKANEESFKALSGKHSNILHIGTHGFTWTDSVAKKQDYFTQRMQLQTLDGSNRFTTPTIDPLNRCGLLFAGANIALQGNSKNLPEGVQDGILTAKEISLMDLRDANLVVLSACETAKGDITSEGVFGLQRAFKMAGVQTIIMSLWKVNDQATQLLMTEFYNNWIGKQQSKREAFHNAQNIVRTQYEEPEYWAGFIMLD